MIILILTLFITIIVNIICQLNSIDQDAGIDCTGFKCVMIIRNYNPDKQSYYGPGDPYIGDQFDAINIAEIEIYDGTLKLADLTGSMSSELEGYGLSKCFDGVTSISINQYWGFCHTLSSSETGQPSLISINLDNRKFDTIKIYNRLQEPVRIIGAEIYILQGLSDVTDRVWSDTFKIANNDKSQPVLLFEFQPKHRCSSNRKVAYVGKFDDSSVGDCSSPSSSSTCNLRACVSYLQGKIGECVLAPGVHRITVGELGIVNVGLSPNSDIRITSTSGPGTTIIDGSGLSNTRLITLDEITANFQIDGVQVRNFIMTTNGNFRNCAWDSCSYEGGGWPAKYCSIYTVAGVIALYSGNAYIRNSIFKGQTASSCSVFRVDAEKASILIEDSSFIDNTSVNMDMCNNYCNTNGAVCIFWDTSKTTANPYFIRNVTFTNNVLSASNLNSLQTFCPTLPGAAIVTSYKSGLGNCPYNFNANYYDQQCYGNGNYENIDCVTPRCLLGQITVPYTGCLDDTPSSDLDRDKSLAYYYNFESSNVQGTLVRNLATNAFDGSLMNGATITSTDGSYKVGQSALTLVSTSDYNTSPYFSIINGVTLGSTGLTFALWFKSSSTGSYTRLFEFSNGADQQSILMYREGSTDKLAYGISPYDTNILSEITGFDGTWRHVVWTIGTDGTFKIYMNGQLSRTDTHRQVPERILRSNSWIGRSANPNTPYNGQVDEFRIYNTVLGASSVLALYNYRGPSSPTTPSESPTQSQPCDSSDMTVVTNFDDSSDGNCQHQSSTCNLRACISYYQGSRGMCVLQPGVHKITQGPLGIQNKGLSPNTFLVITTFDGKKATISGESQPYNSRLMSIDEATATLQIDNIVITDFKQGGVYTNSGTLKMNSGNLFVTNSKFQNNEGWACPAILYDNINIPTTSNIIISGSEFDSNKAINSDWTNNACNRHGSVCLFSSLEGNSGSMLQYSITNVTFNNNEGCGGGEAFTIHLGNNAQYGNCYAFNGMRCYGNGYYSSIPCYTQLCSQHNNLPLSICPIEHPISLIASITPTTSPTSSPITSPVRVKISGSFGLMTSSNINSMFNSVCDDYCRTIKEAIATSMSNSAYSVNGDDVDIYQVSGRRLIAHQDHRRLPQTTTMIGYSVVILSSMQTASSLASTFQSNFNSGSFAQAIQSMASSYGLGSLSQGVGVTGLTVSVSEVDTGSDSTHTSSTHTTTSYGFIGVIFAVLVVVVLSMYILYHYKTRRVLFISGVADEVNINDIQVVLPGVTAVLKTNDGSHFVVFDTNANARRSYVKCSNKDSSNSSVVFRHSKIQLKWKPMLSIISGSSCICMNNANDKKGREPTHVLMANGFLVPIVRTYEHPPQDNAHSLVEAKTVWMRDV